MSEGWLSGSCFCKKNAFEIKGPWAFNVNCHCTICQRLHGAPYAHHIGSKPENFRFTSGGSVENGDLKQVQATKDNSRYHCGECGSPVYSDIPNFAKDVPYSLLERDEKGATKANLPAECHIFYENRAIDVNDKLPKWTGFPGGSTLIEE
ncbi:hypothetical protein K7432_003457 [Basidiobolus ranarum]|uniref:CENP-V/GFA domain-containing protein n=1 Tax=Basidiobolus ranarum TaxID=34480 RepID=A0ABR2X011_9FUNG